MALQVMNEKEVRSLYRHIISINSNQWKYLFRYEIPIACVTDEAGWRADVYAFGDVAIVTGNRPFGTMLASNDVIEKIR